MFSWHPTHTSPNFKTSFKEYLSYWICPLILEEKLERHWILDCLFHLLIHVIYSWYIRIVILQLLTWFLLGFFVYQVITNIFIQFMEELSFLAIVSKIDANLLLSFVKTEKSLSSSYKPYYKQVTIDWMSVQQIKKGLKFELHEREGGSESYLRYKTKLIFYHNNSIGKTI